MALKSQASCPYCNHKNEVVISERDLHIGYTCVTCDDKGGGCKGLFIIRQSFGIKTVEGEEERVKQMAAEFGTDNGAGTKDEPKGEGPTDGGASQ